MINNHYTQVPLEVKHHILEKTRHRSTFDIPEQCLEMGWERMYDEIGERIRFHFESVVADQILDSPILEVTSYKTWWDAFKGECIQWRFLRWCDNKLPKILSKRISSYLLKRFKFETTTIRKTFHVKAVYPNLSLPKEQHHIIVRQLSSSPVEFKNPGGVYRGTQEYIG